LDFTEGMRLDLQYRSGEILSRVKDGLPSG
jgi:hypothetical protein